MDVVCSFLPYLHLLTYLRYLCLALPCLTPYTSMLHRYLCTRYGTDASTLPALQVRTVPYAVPTVRTYVESQVGRAAVASVQRPASRWWRGGAWWTWEEPDDLTGALFGPRRSAMVGPFDSGHACARCARCAAAARERWRRCRGNRVAMIRSRTAQLGVAIGCRRTRLISHELAAGSRAVARVRLSRFCCPKSTGCTFIHSSPQDYPPSCILDHASRPRDSDDEILCAAFPSD
jgi:hypothetical protein